MQSGFDLVTIVNGTSYLDLSSEAGFVYASLQFQTLAYSPAFTNADCAFFSFGSNFSTVDAYLTTEESLEAMLNSEVWQDKFNACDMC